MARQKLTDNNRQQVAVVAIDKLKELKRKYKHPEINKGEYSIGNVRSKPDRLSITLELPDYFLMVGEINTEYIRFKKHPFRIDNVEQNMITVTLHEELKNYQPTRDKKALKRQVVKTLNDLEKYLNKHFRERKEGSIVKNTNKQIEKKWIRWRDYE